MMSWSKRLLSWGLLMLVLVGGSMARQSPFSPSVPYLADLTVRLTPLVGPLCLPWLLGDSPREQVCFAFPPQSGLAWVVPDANTGSCESLSAWVTLAPALPLRVRRCESGLLWEGWWRPLVPFEFFQGETSPLPQDDSSALGRAQRELRELMEPLAPNLFWINRLIPFFAWRCGAWGPWRALPLELGQVRSRVCQHEEKGWARQWEVRP